MKIITVEDAMHEYGLSRKFITKLLNTKGCPILPRKKGQHYRILKDVFEEWLLAQKK
nr:MAG TPA: helix-turn-helix domain protein [Caudoviricetes sp.]